MAKSRLEFDTKYKCNVKDLYNNDEDCVSDIKTIEIKIDDLAKYKGIILDSANNLLELLDLDENISRKLERAYIYAHINNDCDTLDTKYQELFGKVKNLYVKYSETTSYIIPELLKSNYNIVAKYIKNCKELKKYERYLKSIYRYKEHVLNNESEACLSSLSKLMDAPNEIMSALINSDFKYDNIIVDGKEVELTESNYSVYLKHPDKNVRKMAFQNLYKTYGDFKNTLAATLKNEVEKNVVNAKLRKFNNSLESSLFSSEIDTNIYTNLIENVHRNLESLYKYWGLKKKLLGLDEMHIYDTYASVIKKGSKKYKFEDAKELILDAIKPLGEEYLKVMQKAFNDGWIDSCNNKGKINGAYCTTCYEVHPYVVLSYEETLNDVSTIMHEMGHALHYYYACENQSFQDYSYSIFVAEVASQVNEILLFKHLLDKSDSKNEKLTIIDTLLQEYKSTIFRQTMFAEFELFIHEYAEKGGILTSQNMCDKYFELNKLYFGENVIIDEEVKYEWERIHHFYMNFYVYQYATAFVAAIKLANEIYAGNIETRDNYLEFLKLGCTKNPIDSLKVAGIDMTENNVLDDAIKFMDELINDYKKLQGSEE